MDNKNESFEKDEPILAVIQRIRDGTVDPRLLTKEDRQACVETLVAEGYSEVQIAQILKRSEKTIRRDIQVIRDRNSLIPSLEFARQFAGDIVRKGFSHHDYLVRLSNNKDTSDADKIQARVSAWRIIEGLSERLQTLGILPLKPTTIVGDLYHHVADGSEKSFEEIKGMITEIESISKEEGGMPREIEEEIGRLKTKVGKAELLCQVNKVSDKCKEIKEAKTNEEIQNGK